MSNIVYVGASLDGYIADKDGGLDFLQSVPNPDNLDFGFQKFMDGIDALVMGRKTFETVLGFGGPWPYSKPVFVLSSVMNSVPESLAGKAGIIHGTPEEIVAELCAKGFSRLYIDGGQVIRSFFERDMVDELIVTIIPVLLGGGTPLFGAFPSQMRFKLESSQVFLGALVQSRYSRAR